MKTIFIVDDKYTNLTMAEEVLESQYRIMTLSSAAKMFALLEKVIPDLILLDIEMPEMDGFEALQLLKDNKTYSNIPVIFLTSMSSSELEIRGLQLGAVDFITKPFTDLVLLNRVKNQLDLDGIIKDRTARLQRLKNAIVFVLADMVENRDKITGGHVERTTAYIKILIDELIKRGIYVDEFKGIDIDLYASSARLHDIGKVTISDVILNKPGKLTDREFTLMKTHAKEGERIIEQIVERAGDQEEFLENAKLFAGYHHERWDGGGYPYHLARTEIPIQGRIMAFADVYDALISTRPYKLAYSHEESVKIMLDGAGTQFDPRISDVFAEIHEEFNALNKPVN